VAYQRHRLSCSRRASSFSWVRMLLAGMDFAAIDDFADVEAVLEEVGQRPHSGGDLGYRVFRRGDHDRLHLIYSVLKLQHALGDEAGHADQELNCSATLLWS
jgi:hypothetical protein